MSASDQASSQEIEFSGSSSALPADLVRALVWLRSHARQGRLVLLGDPGRNYFSAQGLSELARYEIPTSLQLENRGMRETVVWQVLPHP